MSCRHGDGTGPSRGLIGFMSTSDAQSGRWRIGAKPSQLLELSRSIEMCADEVDAAARRCATSVYLAPVAPFRLARQACSVAGRVREVGRALDAADLAQRLTRVSSTLRVSMRSRGLVAPSHEARQLALGVGRRFLRIDARGHGAAVEIFGDLSRAEHIAVIVPGMTNSLHDYDRNARVKGRDLEAAMRSRNPDVAVVSWLGYRTPDLSVRGLLEGATSGRARTGAGALVADLELIRRMAPRSHITIVGHSYGSVVVGETLKSRVLSARVDALGIGDVAVVGSPGMNVSSRTQLGHHEIDVWAARVRGIDPGHLSVTLKTRWRAFVAPLVPLPLLLPFTGPPVIVSVDFGPPRPRDIVPYAPVHGRDPAASSFGARPFSAAGATDHGSYFVPGTVSLANLARIATDEEPPADSLGDPLGDPDDGVAPGRGRRGKPSKRVAKGGGRQ